MQTIGKIEDEELKAALAQAARISDKGADLIVAYVDTPESLQATLKQTRTALRKADPIWMVYAKGPGHPLSEAAIRSLLRANGMIDTKIASVSRELAALRFSIRKSD